MKKQLEESKIERQHKEECEAIRRLIAMQPPRSETQKYISELEKEIAILEAENTAGSRMLDLRRKQFFLLLHVVDELQSTLDEDQKSLVEELRNAMEEQKICLEETNEGPEAMVVDYFLIYLKLVPSTSQQMLKHFSHRPCCLIMHLYVCIHHIRKKRERKMELFSFEDLFFLLKIYLSSSC